MTVRRRLFISNDTNISPSNWGEQDVPFHAAPPPPPPPPPPPVPPPFDLVTGASFGYSTRRLRTGYSGAALRAVRMSDSTQLDIGFLPNESLDTPALLAFAGAGAGVSARIANWYDQSIHALTLNSIGTGMRLVVDGAIEKTIGTHPALRMLEGETTPCTANNIIFDPSKGTIFTVAHVATGGSSNAAFPDGGNPGIWGMNGGSPNDGWALAFPQTVYPGAPCALFGRTYSPVFFIQIQQPTTVPYDFGTDQTFVYRFDVTDAPPNVNKAYNGLQTPGTSNFANAYNNPSPYVFSVGGTFNGAADGWVAEILGYSTELSLADTNTLAFNQKDYWGVPWQTVTV